jgi:hypothetical protein
MRPNTTIKIARGLVCILLLVFWPREAQAFQSRTHSMEWWVNISEVIAIVEITGLRELKSESPTHKLHELEGRVRETLLGKNPNTVTFQQHYSPEARPEDEWYLRGIAMRESVLVFLATNTNTRKMEMAFWVNLSSPDKKAHPYLVCHAAYNNDGKYLSDAKSILSLVKARIKQGETTKRRGLIVPFPHAEQGIWWDFVITAEAKYKQRLIKELRASDPSTAPIYNLVSYSGPETVRLIRPFLKDNTKHEAKLGMETITYYPVRQTAYEALILLGEKVERPEHYYPNLSVQTGFESSSYFEYGPHPPRKR